MSAEFLASRIEKLAQAPKTELTFQELICLGMDAVNIQHAAQAELKIIQIDFDTAYQRMMKSSHQRAAVESELRRRNVTDLGQAQHVLTHGMIAPESIAPFVRPDIANRPKI